MKLSRLSIIKYTFVKGTFPDDQYEWLKENLLKKFNVDFILETNIGETSVNSTIWMNNCSLLSPIEFR